MDPQLHILLLLLPKRFTSRSANTQNASHFAAAGMRIPAVRSALGCVVVPKVVQQTLSDVHLQVTVDATCTQ